MIFSKVFNLIIDNNNRVNNNKSDYYATVVKNAFKNVVRESVRVDIVRDLFRPICELILTGLPILLFSTYSA
jgi:hypothetical protein